MSNPRKIYWDSSCFICFLNKDKVEEARRLICEDVLQHARNNDVVIFTSTWTIVEVIRPKMHGAAPLPAWAEAAILAVEKKFPQARHELETLWKRYQSNDPARKLTAAQVAKIQAMFTWPFIKRINLDPPVAERSVELSRQFGLKPADAVHAASALVHRVPVLQRWDRDFKKVAHLLTVEDPVRLSPPSLFDAFASPSVGPTPADFQDKQDQTTVAASPAPVAGNGAAKATGQTGAAGGPPAPPKTEEP